MARPVLFTLSSSSSSAQPVVGPLADLDVVAVSRRDAVSEIAAHGAGRWALLGADDGVQAAVDLAEQVLCGSAPLFGLAGLVTVGGTPTYATPAGLPLLELGRPEDTDAIDAWWTTRAGLGPQVPDDYARMLASGRTSARTRAALAGRILADDPAYAAQVVGADGLATLRAVAEQVVPQDGPPLDLAARVDAQLAAGIGDGWRPDGQPPDAEAYRRALAELSGLADLSGPERDERLRGLEGSLELWFEDCRTDLARQWLAHPATMARIGFDGVANGGDGGVAAFEGFTLLTLGGRETWEPAMSAATEADR